MARKNMHLLRYRLCTNMSQDGEGKAGRWEGGREVGLHKAVHVDVLSMAFRENLVNKRETNVSGLPIKTGPSEI
jgi:hypothetical protein